MEWGILQHQRLVESLLTRHVLGMHVARPAAIPTGTQISLHQINYFRYILARHISIDITSCWSYTERRSRLYTGQLSGRYTGCSDMLRDAYFCSCTLVRVLMAGLCRCYHLRCENAGQVCSAGCLWPKRLD